MQSESKPDKISKPFSVQKLRKNISDAGQAGLLSYGLLNLVYYTSATAFAWKLSNNPPSILSEMSFQKKLYVVFRKLSNVLLIVWTGSQVTKVFRLLGAIALSPFMEKWITVTQKRFAFKSRNELFWFTVAGILLVTTSFYIYLILSAALFHA